MTELDHDLVHRERAWQQWRVERESQLSRPLGVLSQVGLDWLGPEPSRPDHVLGQWRVVRNDASVLVAEVTATAADGLRLLRDDHSGSDHSNGDRPLDGTATVEVAEAGAVRFAGYGAGIQVEVIRRTGRYGLRTYDPAAPALRSFAGVSSYDYSPSWVITGRYHPYPEPRIVRVGGAQPGLVHDRVAAGAVSFDYDGAAWTLIVFGDYGTTILFHDTTNNRATAAWRVLPVELDRTGLVVLDFNRAANLPFAFTPYGTCPRPPDQNSLPFGVTAGEWRPAVRG